jgi:hypothetical protein
MDDILISHACSKQLQKFFTYLLFLVALGFELRASHLQSRLSTTQATLPVPITKIF